MICDVNFVEEKQHEIHLWVGSGQNQSKATACVPSSLESSTRDIVTLDVAGMISVSFFLNNRLEAMMFVGHIVNDPFRSVRFIKPILAFNLVTMPGLPGLFVVVCMIVLYTVAIFKFDCILKNDSSGNDKSTKSADRSNATRTNNFVFFFFMFLLLTSA